MNESVHQKLSLAVKKCKSHTTEVMEFAVSSTMMSHNFGYEKSSLLHALGWVNANVAKGLKANDERSFQSAARKHKLEAGTTTKHRRKVRCLEVREDGHRAEDREGRVNYGASGSGNSGGARTRNSSAYVRGDVIRLCECA